MNHSSRSRHGFTLIEILVVIAIIGILAAIILASVSSARSQGADAAIKGDLHDIQTEAEIASSANDNVYPADMCTNPGGPDATIDNAINNILSLNGSTTVYCYVDTTNNAYAVSATLASNPSSFWCVDSTGNVKSESVQLSGTDSSC